MAPGIPWQSGATRYGYREERRKTAKGKGVSALRFLKQFVAMPGTTGACWPSSKALAKVMADKAAVDRASFVVEFGPGTGAITEAITENLCDGAQFLALEVNPEFVRFLRHRYPELKVVQDSAVNARKYLKEAGSDTCDSIVSGLPFASFDDRLQDDLLEVSRAILNPGGRFVTFGYFHSLYLPRGRRFRKRLLQSFSHVDITPIVWPNIPPAFAYCAEK